MSASFRSVIRFAVRFSRSRAPKGVVSVFFRNINFISPHKFPELNSPLRLIEHEVVDTFGHSLRNQL
jgi:hypothetical protein